MPAYVPHPAHTDTDPSLARYAPLLARLLHARGITSEEEAERFLRPEWSRDTHDPFLMKDMRRAVERIVQAMAKGETMAIWSDYDMDGIPGAVVLYETFRAVGYTNVLHHTPHRNRDGFGLNKVGIDELVERGVTLAITVDCGIGDVEMVAYAHGRGLEVIVTDHHIPHETLPPAYAVLDPKREGCGYPEKMLCGAGVAFKLAQAVLSHIRDDPTITCSWSGKEARGSVPPEGWEKWLLDLVGMATIADMVPLTGENRAFAHFGLVVLRKTRRLGVQALLKKARVDQRYLTEEDVGFTIAPRVNAASRMGHARDAFALLVAADAEEAGARAEELDRINGERKTVVATMKREIHARLKKRGEPKPVIVMGDPDWKPSLLGLVAGGLAEEFSRPVFLWGREEGVSIKGSCRSGGGVNVHEVMHHARNVFVEYGGHAQAGGFSLSEPQVHLLEAALVEAHAHLATAVADAVRQVDAELAVDEVTWSTYRAVAELAPFGEGNPRPVFLFRNVAIKNVRRFGKGNEHLELALERSDGSTVKAIAFFTDEGRYPALTQGVPVTLVAHLEESNFRGRELRLRLVDVL